MASLETARFRLRFMDERDEALYCHLYTDPDVMRRIVPPLSGEVAAQAFERACAHNLKDEPGHRFWAIEDKASDDGIGMAALKRMGDCAEIGVMLRQGWWNSGVSSETFVEVIGYAFTGMGLALLCAERPDDDHALLIDKLLDKFGFVRAPERATEPHLARWELPREIWEARRNPA